MASASPDLVRRLPAFREWIAAEQRPALYSAKIKLLTTCNLDCTFCPWRVSARAAREILTLEELSAPLRELREFGVVGVHFSGGEPMLHPELPQILAYCRELGIARLSLTSNGTLATRPMVQRLYDAGLRSINVSVDGESAELHAAQPRSLDRAIRGLANLVAVRDARRGEGRLRVRVNSIVANSNLLALPALIRELHALGVDGVHLIPIQDTPHLLLTARQVAWFRDRVLTTLVDCFGAAAVNRDPFDDAGALEGEYVREFYRANTCYVPYVHTFIRANGEVHVCCQRQDRTAPLGNIRHQSLHDILTGDAYRAERRRSDRRACRVCNMFTQFNQLLDQALVAPAPTAGDGLVQIQVRSVHADA